MRKLSHITILDEYAVDMGVVLGQGSTGCVYQGLNMKNSTKVAIKIIDLRTIDNEVAQYLLQMEKTAIMILNSPYVLKGLKVAEDARYCFLVTELCTGGTLKRLIKNSPAGYLPEQTALRIISQILLGEKSLVERGIVHRDLKPANIMLHGQTAKIIDFGYCSIQGYSPPSLEYNVGSPSYMAPESFKHNIYNEKTEIWAIGVILFECITGKTIDEGRHMAEVYHQIKVLGVPFPNHVSYFLRNIINWCLSTNPNTRPTCSELIQVYFTPKRTSKTRLNAHKQQSVLQLQSETAYQSHSPAKEIQILRQKIPNRIIGIQKEEQLFKSTRMENKSKSYKMPQFLQASTKLSSKKTHEKISKLEKENLGQEQKDQRVRPSKSGKLCRNERDAQKNINNSPSLSGWQYGAASVVKKLHPLLCRKGLELNEASKKLGGTGTPFFKTRIASIQVSVSPYGTVKKSGNKFTGSQSKQGAARFKRTLTDRLSMIRA